MPCILYLDLHPREDELSLIPHRTSPQRRSWILQSLCRIRARLREPT